MAKRHYFEVTSKFGPRDLFLLLKNICEESSLRSQGAAFEFDWPKRKVQLSATSRCAAEDALELLLSRVKKKAGPGLILPGETKEADGRAVIPIGVLLQSADVYAELIMAALAEMGMPSVEQEFEGNGFSVPGGKLTELLRYKEIVMSFPLPVYLTVEDRGEK